MDVVQSQNCFHFNRGEVTRKIETELIVRSLISVLQMKQIEARLAASQKEKESIAPPPVPATPWSGQTLSWANTASQWNSIQGAFENV